MSGRPLLGDEERLLIDDLLDGGLDGVPSAAAELLARLEREPAVRECLLDRALLHAGLRRSLGRRSLSEWAMNQAQMEESPEIAAAGRPSEPRAIWSSMRLWHGAPVGLVAAACLGIVFTSWRALSGHSATVRAGIGAAGLTAGSIVRDERHQLTAGVLELETCRGVTVVIEAPAEFQFESSQRLRLAKGRVAADVPPGARGFTVVTPSGEAIDLGTRFAVDVPASGGAEVHVFDGEVVAQGVGSAATSLRDGEAFSLAANATRELRSAAFIRRDEVPQLAAAVAAGQERASREALRHLHDDPTLISVIDFEPAADEATRDPGEADPDGRYSVVQGRWPGSRAADFVHVGDRLPIDVGGGADWPQLTVAAWVRLDRLGEPYQSLFHTDNWARENPGQVHWMIVDSGVMRLALPGARLAPGASERHQFPESRTSVLGTEGRWMHLAFVYDSVARTAGFHVDGRPDGVTRLAVAPAARLGPACVGNWNRTDRKLSGRMDELVFIGRALSADEVRALYDAGVPYR